MLSPSRQTSSTNLSSTHDHEPYPITPILSDIQSDAIWQAHQAVEQFKNAPKFLNYTSSQLNGEPQGNAPTKDTSSISQQAQTLGFPGMMSNSDLSTIDKDSPSQILGWKKKVKTELCRFWLNGLACENSMKEQGCGFAHGSEELQRKKGLSRQYLTSVCKNFLQNPNSCSYGQRCIFQHPRLDVRLRQKYVDMVQDNARYTAMRLFQEIEGAKCIYINTYAATTPRLSVFKKIYAGFKDTAEDSQDYDDDLQSDCQPVVRSDANQFEESTQTTQIIQ